MARDLPPERKPGEPRHTQGMGREYKKKQGACFTRVESFMRAVCFSCTEVTWRIRWQQN